MLRLKGLAGKSFRLLKDLRASPFSSLKDLLRVLKDLLASPFRFLNDLVASPLASERTYMQVLLDV